MPATEINTYDEISHLMTDEEREAMKSLTDEGFEEVTAGDEFADEEVRTARLSQIEREREEAEKANDAPDQVEDPSAKTDGEGDEASKATDKVAPPDEKKAEAEGAEALPEQEAAEQKAPAPEIPQADILAKAMEAADAKIEARIADLTQKLDDVEITSEEFKAAVAEANAARRGLVADAVADISFQSATKAYLDQYPGLRTKEHVEGLNAEFGLIDGSPMFANLSDSDKLALAHERYNNSLDIARSRGLSVPASVPLKTSAKPEAAKTEAKPEAKPALAPKPAAPMTLARLPASDAAAPGEGQSSQLRKLVDSNDPDAIQAALMDGNISIRDLENM